MFNSVIVKYNNMKLHAALAVKCNSSMNFIKASGTGEVNTTFEWIFWLCVEGHINGETTGNTPYAKSQWSTFRQGL
jgi:hypothetical protein